jgi:rubrerythrin
MVRPTHLEDHARIAARRLRRAILCQLGVASPLLVLAAGCSPTPSPTGDEGGVTTNPGSNDGNADSMDAEVSSEVDSGSSMSDETGPMDDESEGGPKYDLSPLYDIPPPPECSSSYVTEEEIIAAHPDCTLGPFDPNLYVTFFEICVTHPPDGDCSDICVPDMLCEGTDCYWGPVYETCGPYVIDGHCCLLLAGDEPPPVGRPFVIAGETRLARLDGVPGDHVTAHWLEVARGEHASIAAFARFVAVLQRHGAPARLIAEALAAAADEARHAEQTLALASRFAGRELEFGALAIDDALRDTDDLAAALLAAVREGCIDETLAAHEAACLAAVAEDPQVAIVLEQIASDEARHAALAWKFVEWVLGQRPELRAVVVEVFASVSAPRVFQSPELQPNALALGCPSTELRARWRRIGLRELVGPCAARLLAEASPDELRA